MEDKINILFITSFYSALKNSVEKGVWLPEGMPAISKLFMELNVKNIDFDAILIDRQFCTAREKKSRFYFTEFKGSFYIFRLPNCLQIPIADIRYIKEIVILISDFIFVIHCSKIIKHNNYSVIYVDRKNVLLGAVFAVFFRKKVVLRLHGVANLYDKFNNYKSRTINIFRYFSFKAPFKYIICSEDGSPSKEFITRFTNKKTPSTILLNGVDKTNSSQFDIRKRHYIADGKPIILYVGRLDAGKGGNEFLQSMIKLNKMNNSFTAIIVGNGKFYENFKELAKEHDNIIFAGSIRHDEINCYYEQADIYVSLNTYGNLSNTVLEALQAGNCIVTLKKDEKSLRDYSTEKYLYDVACLIDRNKILEELPEILIMLISDPVKLNEIKKSTLTKAGKILKSWEKRISEEINILESVSRL